MAGITRLSSRLRSCANSSSPASLRSVSVKSADRSALIASMLKTNSSAWARIAAKRSSAASLSSSTARCASKARWPSAIVAETAASSSGVAAAARFGAAATSVLLYSATPKAEFQLGNAALVDAGLRAADAVEREPAHQTRGHGQDDGAANPQVELGRDPKAQGKQPLEVVAHCSMLSMLSTGWYRPSLPITVRKTASDPWLWLPPSP